MDIIRLLKLQSIFGKTPDGRFIGKSLISKIENSLNNPKISENQIIRCSNCGLILEEDLFSSGCPNCGSKDFDFFKNK